MGVRDVHVADTVKLFLFPGILVLFNQIVLIILHRRTGGDSGLGAAVHSKLIDIIAGHIFHNKGTV